MVVINYIETKKIYPHPDNPRTDLGDLTELADSIRENGIMQNLTLIPYFDPKTKQEAEGMLDCYYVVIGHRRLAAAKRAGLEKVPCVIEEMEYKKQISTMLMENMQRSDLTPYEQAQGFQMMIDLGASIADVVKDTGFSESTIRHRLKLTELDKDLLQEKGGTIQMKDLIELERIQNPEEKNKLLKELGTSNFRYQYEIALRKQDMEAKKQAFRETFEPYAEITHEYRQGYNSEESWYMSGITPEKIRELPAEELCRNLEEPLLTLTDYNAILYRKEWTDPEQEEAEEEQNEAKREEQERKDRRNQLQEIIETMENCRMRFAKHITVKAVKTNLNKTIRELGLRVATDEVNWDVQAVLKEVLDFKEPKNQDDEYDEDEAWEAHLKGYLKQYPEVTFFQIAYASMEKDITIYYDCAYRGDEDVTRLYEFLEAYGYERSDTEKQILDGTHPLYSQKEV